MLSEHDIDEGSTSQTFGANHSSTQVSPITKSAQKTGIRCLPPRRMLGRLLRAFREARERLMQEGASQGLKHKNNFNRV